MLVRYALGNKTTINYFLFVKRYNDSLRYVTVCLVVCGKFIFPFGICLYLSYFKDYVRFGVIRYCREFLNVNLNNDFDRGAPNIIRRVRMGNVNDNNTVTRFRSTNFSQQCSYDRIFWAYIVSKDQFLFFSFCNRVHTTVINDSFIYCFCAGNVFRAYVSVPGFGVSNWRFILAKVSNVYRALLSVGSVRSNLVICDRPAIASTAPSGIRIRRIIKDPVTIWGCDVSTLDQACTAMGGKPAFFRVAMCRIFPYALTIIFMDAFAIRIRLSVGDICWVTCLP